MQKVNKFDVIQTLIIIVSIISTIWYFNSNLKTNFDKRFEQVDKRFDRIEKRLDRIEQNHLEHITNIHLGQNK